MSGADGPICGAAHLTLPAAVAPGPLPLPLNGGEGLFSGRSQKALSNSHRSIVAIAVTAALAVPSLATAQHPAALGNLMTTFIQPRHIKLGLAGSEQNGPMLLALARGPDLFPSCK